MHLARAVDCRAVIVYGGRERPEISGYICNKILSPPAMLAVLAKKSMRLWSSLHDGHQLGHGH